MGTLDDLAAEAGELYGLPPEDFVPARTERARRARAEGDRELAQRIGELAKPTTAAWILNQLMRRRPDAVEQLVSLGAELREAQRTLAGDQMRALGRQRQTVVATFSRQVAGLADELGRPLGAEVARQVDDTLRAAVSDPDAGAALLSGRLTSAMSYVGLGGVDVSAAMAVPGVHRPAPTRPAAVPDREPDREPDDSGAAREGRREAARADLAQAEAATRRATAEQRRCKQRADRLRVRAEDVAARLATLRTELERVTTEAERVDAALGEAEAAREAAAAAEREAHSALERAKAVLDGVG